MSQTVYYKIFLIILFSFSDTYLYGKLLRPVKDRDQKEILVINSKRRVYYPIKKSGLLYQVSGPARAEFISRYPVLKGKKKSHSFNYIIVLNGKDTIKVNHRYKVQSSIRSVQHPKHRYTYSGNYFINLGEGIHTVRLVEYENQKYPVLARVLAKEFGSMGKNKKILKPTIHQNPIGIITNGKTIDYFECNYSYPLQIEAKGVKTLRILTRLEFADSMGQEESYRLKVREGDKIIGTYYFNTERSSVSQINGRMDKVPGKWRSCDIRVPKGTHNYIVEVSDRGKTVLTRFMLY